VVGVTFDSFNPNVSPAKAGPDVPLRSTAPYSSLRRKPFDAVRILAEKKTFGGRLEEGQGACVGSRSIDHVTGGQNGGLAVPPPTTLQQPFARCKGKPLRRMRKSTGARGSGPGARK